MSLLNQMQDLAGINSLHMQQFLAMAGAGKTSTTEQIHQLAQLQQEHRRQKENLEEMQRMGYTAHTWSQQHSPIGIGQTLQYKGEKPEEMTMFGEFKQDMKNFVREHKGLIYSIVLFYLVDHFCFEGKFKAKLQELMQRLIGKVEDKLDKVGAPNAAG